MPRDKTSLQGRESSTITSYTHTHTWSHFACDCHAALQDAWRESKIIGRGEAPSVCGLVELEGMVLAVVVEIGGKDIENGIFRQDGRINRSQEGKGEVRYRIRPWRDGLRAVPLTQAGPSINKFPAGAPTSSSASVTLSDDTAARPRNPVRQNAGQILAFAGFKHLISVIKYQEFIWVCT